MSETARTEAPEPTSEETPPESEGSALRQDPIRRITKIVLAVCLVIFVWYLFADRLTPFTSQARVKSLVVPIVPQVSGYLTGINVGLHSVVDEDEVLFQIDERLFDVAIEQAEAEVDKAAQAVGARTATVKSAAARVGVSRASLDRAQRNFNRTQAILEKNPGALSQADRDRAETSLAQATERLASAEADLEKAKEELGAVGPDNPDLRRAVAALERAQLDRAFSTILAPTRGAIESFSVDIGYYAAAGQPLATFVPVTDAWIQADMRENNISRIEPGDRVELTLDVAPGRIFDGVVRSVGYGVTPEGDGTNRGDLPQVSSSQAWLRDPQRFPVIVGMESSEVQGLLRSGGQASVIVYTGRNFVLNLIGGAQIRLSSLLSYVR